MSSVRQVLLAKDFAQTTPKAGQRLFAVEHSVAGDNADTSITSIDVGFGTLWIDHPDQLGPRIEPFANFREHFAAPMVGGANLDDEIRCEACVAARRNERCARLSDEGNVGRAYGVGI